MAGVQQVVHANRLHRTGIKVHHDVTHMKKPHRADFDVHATRVRYADLVGVMGGCARLEMGGGG